MMIKKKNTIWKDEEVYDFSPAVLDVMDNPPTPYANIVIIAIVLFSFCGIVWAIFAKMDIIASGTGTVIPKGKVKLVQPLEPGIVTAINVRDGQLVKKGEILISMDSTDVVTDLETSKKDFDKVTLDIQRLEAELSGDPEVLSKLQALSPGEKKLHINLLASSIESHQKQMASLDDQISSLRAEKDAIEAEKKRNEVAYPLSKKLFRKKQRLAKKQLISEAELLQEEIALNNARQDLSAAKSKLSEVSARLDRAEQERELANSQYQRDLLSQLTEAENEQKSLQQQLEKAKNRKTHFELRAPASGIVQQLAVNNTGSVVTAAQTLLVIVPLDGGLEVEAKILNKDIGFVHEGQEVSVKVVAYPFTKYGDLSGKIEWVAKDAVIDEQAGAIYPVRISVSSYKLPNIVQGRQGILSPGMMVNADIKVGKRKVFEYFLDPIMRYKNKSLREM